MPCSLSAPENLFCGVFPGNAVADKKQRRRYSEEFLAQSGSDPPIPLFQVTANRKQSILEAKVVSKTSLNCKNLAGIF
ncbi:hypothetical protein [Leisingera sp.]|uniref:hypothetical protein n=1 Tax=Leisingera sp. TaxID=1879318 RepID=UPI003A931162